MFEEAGEAESTAASLEARLDAMERWLERRDEQQRRQQAIECELHLHDLQRHHVLLVVIAAKAAARVRAKAGAVPGEMPPRPIAAQADGWMQPAFI